MVNKLQIVRIDNLTVHKLDLQIGDNIIGRGAATGHVDNPIFENAVTINLAPNGEMTMTPMLSCYMKSVGSTRWRSLKIGSTIPIHIGDICSLLPEKSWFKVTSCDDSTMEDADSNSKRKATNSSNEEPPGKKLKSDSSMQTIYSQSQSMLDDWDTEQGNLEDGVDCTDTNDVHNSSNKNNNSASPNTNPSVEIIDTDNTKHSTEDTTVKQSKSSDVKTKTSDSSSNSKETTANCDETGKKIKWDCGRHFSDQTDTKVSEGPEKSDEVVASAEENPAAETTVASEQAPRNKCTYGSQCYRRNSDHLMKFSHPGDADYDVPDERPECPYGVRCYRKNPQHKLDYKHTKNRRSRAQTPVRARTAGDGSGTDVSSAEESVDESEYEPSLYDGTSDDYKSEFDDKSDYDAVSDADDK